MSEDAEDYPGLVVNDARVGGSITLGPTRGPLWAVIATVVCDGWDYTREHYPWIEDHGWTAGRLGQFLHWLFDQRREFARLLCVLADVSRRSYDRNGDWWGGWVDWSDVPEDRDRVVAALRACLDVLEADRG